MLCSRVNLRFFSTSMKSLRSRLRSLPRYHQPNYVVKRIPNTSAAVSCAPHWDIERQSLYYVDSSRAQLMRYDYESNKNYSCTLRGEKCVSFIVPIEESSKKFAVGCGNKVALVTWDGYTHKSHIDTVLFEVRKENQGANRLIAKCDPEGRLFTGITRPLNELLDSHDGELYRYDGQTGEVDVLQRAVAPSGFAWNEDKSKFYLMDRANFKVKEYDYFLERGETCNEGRVIHEMQRNVQPVGMDIDADGNLYVAACNGYSIHKIKPHTGELLSEIKLPGKKVTSCAFGGPDMNILFVTTSAVDQTKTEGALFKVIGLQTNGLPLSGLRLAEQFKNTIDEQYVNPLVLSTRQRLYAHNKY